MSPETYLEIFGYIGTALVITSMMMTSLVKLRVLNICGSVISMIYSFIGGAWPIVVMNLALIIINVVQLIKARFNKDEFTCIKTTLSDSSANHFVSLFNDDIIKFFPSFSKDALLDRECFIIFSHSEIAGILIGKREGQLIKVDIDYTSPKYRNLSVGTFLYDYLKTFEISMLEANFEVQQHKLYLKKMNFEEINGKMIKKI